MTAEEAIRFLNRIVFDDLYGETCKIACLKAIKALKKVEEYKRFEEQGLLLRLPCKVGADIYTIPSEVNFELNVLSGLSKNNRIYHQKVSRIVLDGDNWYVECDKDREYGTGNILVDIFYKKTWFLTREEAEAKLKEMEGNA